MSARKSPGRSVPPPIPRKAIAPVLRRPTPEIEFLADELVLDDTGDFLADDLVIEDGTDEAAVEFVGPSDPPPSAPGPSHPTGSQGPPHASATVRARWFAAAAAALLALAATAHAIGSHPFGAVRGRVPANAPPVQAPERPKLPSASHAASASVAAAPTAGGGSEAGPSQEQVAQAADAKRASQHALEQGRMAAAITLGERAVKLDPADAESWLILGAAYLQHGAPSDARRCFSSCVAQATRGDRNECAALAR